MPIEIGQGISHAHYQVEDANIPFYLASAITAADVGKAVTQDTTAARTVKLAGDGDVVIGRLDTFEDRVSEGVKVGNIQLKGGMRFTYPSSGVTFAIGDRIIGAGSGLVKPHTVASNATGAVPMPFYMVTAINTTAKTVEVIAF